MSAERPLACFAITPPGVETITATELAALGTRVAGTEPGGVSFDAPPAELYAANLELRTASRLLIRLAEFPARAFYELERKARRVPWASVLSPGAPARFRVTSRKSRLYHQDAIAERLLAASGGAAARETPDEEDESGAEAANTQLFVVRVLRDVVTVSADSSGELLHRRGYRLATGKSPLRETLGAAMLLAAGYDGGSALLDPFMGAGTLPIEAALIARRIPPGWRRSFAFERWPTFETAAWARVRGQAESRMLAAAPAPIVGADRDAGAVEAARGNAERAGVAGDLRLTQAAVSALNPPAGRGLVATNPPYGVRMGDRRELRNLFARLGSVLRERCPGWTLAILTAAREHEAALGLTLEPRWQSSNGGVKVRCSVGVVGSDI